MEQQSLTVLIVGKPFEMFRNRNLQGQCGSYFEQTVDGKFCLIIYLDNMTTEEELMLRFLKINVHTIKETDDFLLTIIQFGDGAVFEMSFDPTLYTDERKGLFIKSNMLTIIGVDSNTNIIKTLRYVNMPFKLHELMKDTWGKAMLRNDFSEKYKRWVNDLDNKYTIFELFDMGENCGYMGKNEFKK
jgi:hypothetical protein